MGLSENWSVLANFDTNDIDFKFRMIHRLMTVTFFILTIVSMLIYPHYDFINQYVSELGYSYLKNGEINVYPRLIFNLMIIVQIGLALLMIRYLREIKSIVSIFYILIALAFVFILFPSDTAKYYHGFGANLLIWTAIGLLIYLLYPQHKGILFTFVPFFIFCQILRYLGYLPQFNVLNIILEAVQKTLIFGIYIFLFFLSYSKLRSFP